MISALHLIWILPATAVVFLMIGGSLRGVVKPIAGYQPQHPGPIGDPPTLASMMSGPLGKGERIELLGPSKWELLAEILDRLKADERYVHHIAADYEVDLSGPDGGSPIFRFIEALRALIAFGERESAGLKHSLDETVGELETAKVGAFGLQQETAYCGAAAGRLGIEPDGDVRPVCGLIRAVESLLLDARTELADARRQRDNAIGELMDLKQALDGTEENDGERLEVRGENDKAEQSNRLAKLGETVDFALKSYRTQHIYGDAGESMLLYDVFSHAASSSIAPSTIRVGIQELGLLYDHILGAIKDAEDAGPPGEAVDSDLSPAEGDLTSNLDDGGGRRPPAKGITMLGKCKMCAGTGQVKGPVSKQVGPLTVEGIGACNCPACNGEGNVELGCLKAVCDRLIAWHDADPGPGEYSVDRVRDFIAIVSDTRKLRWATANPTAATNDVNKQPG